MSKCEELESSISEALCHRVERSERSNWWPRRNVGCQMSLPALIVIIDSSRSEAAGFDKSSLSMRKSAQEVWQ